MEKIKNLLFLKGVPKKDEEIENFIFDIEDEIFKHL